MEAFLVSTGAVALGEVGDKTQLLALMLAARFGRPWPIIAGIAVATLANHAAAAAFGGALAHWLDPQWLRWGLGAAFLSVAAWLLVPDRADELDASAGHGRLGVFGLTTVAFFLAEMGDKTQVATVMLAARFDGALVAVTAGTTLGMLLANVPVVLLGGSALRRLPARAVRRVAAALFALLGVLVLAGVGL